MAGTVVLAFFIASPLRAPVAFLAFAFGRRKYGVRFLLLLVTVESICLFAACGALRVLAAAIYVL